MSRRNRARRRVRTHARADRVPSACTCRPAPRRCRRPRSCSPCRRGSPAVPTRCCARRRAATAPPIRPCSSRRALCGIDRSIQDRRRAGDRGDGVRHGDRAARRQDLRPRQCLGHRGQAARRRRSGTAPRSTCPAGPSEVLVIADGGRATPTSSRPTCCRRPSTARIRRSCWSRRRATSARNADRRRSDAQLDEPAPRGTSPSGRWPPARMHLVADHRDGVRGQQPTTRPST